jgi:hypothetical protein
MTLPPSGGYRHPKFALCSPAETITSAATLRVHRAGTAQTSHEIPLNFEISGSRPSANKTFHRGFQSDLSIKTCR